MQYFSCVCGGWIFLVFQSLFAMDTRALYRSLFIRKVSHESAVDFELPTLHMILLYVEWFIGQECVPAVATFVSTEVMRRKLKNTKEFIAEFNKILDNSEFVEELRRIVGSEVYDYACAAIGDGETSIPLGLAPTLQMFYESCKTCGVPKYIRSFCLRCGLIHDVSNKEVVYCGLSSRGKRMVCSKTENDSMRTKNSIIVSSSSSDLSLTRLSTVDNVRRLETTDFIAPKSIPLVVKAVSLEKLMALHRQQKALQSNEVKLPDDDGILAIEVMKSQPVIIDLISDDESDTAVFVSDKAHAPYTSQIATESDSDSEDVIVKSEPICALSTSWVVKKEVATSGYLETSESSSDITAAESTELNGGIDPDQVAVKMEWPARRMNKYEMAAMRGIIQCTTIFFSF